jgi:hypothetical protein
LIKGLYIKYLQQHLPSEHLLHNTPQARQNIQENRLQFKVSEIRTQHRTVASMWLLPPTSLPFPFSAYLLIKRKFKRGTIA